MPKKELLDYILKKQREGKTQDEIIYKLTSHGWPLVEVHEGFNYLAIMQSPSQARSMYEPTRISEAPEQHLPAQNIPQNPHWFFNPSLNTGVLILIIALLVGYGFFFISPFGQSLGIFSAISFTYSSIFTVVTVLLSALGVHLVTYILSIQSRSFAKALIYTSVLLIVSAILSTLIIAAKLPGLVVPIFFIIFGLVFFWYYYETTIVKTFLGVILNIIFGAIITVILTIFGFILGIGLFTNFLASQGIKGTNPNVVPTGMPMNMNLNVR